MTGLAPAHNHAYPPARPSLARIRRLQHVHVGGPGPVLLFLQDLTLTGSAWLCRPREVRADEGCA